MDKNIKASDILHPLGSSRKDQVNNKIQATTIIKTAITQIIKDLDLSPDYSTEEKISELLYGISEYIDIRKMIHYGQILIEFSDEGFIITYIDGNSSKPSSFPIEISESYSNNNKNVIEALCKLAYTIIRATDMDNTDHNSYRFTCGLDPNGDEEYKELHSIIDDTTYEKLTNAGYEIIKTVGD